MRKLLLFMLLVLMLIVCAISPTPAMASAVETVSPPDTTLAEAINAYRTAHGQQPLKITYHLTYVATYRVQLTMFSDIDLNKIQIDTRLMPSNYTWQELTFGGDTPDALTIDDPQAVLDHLINQRGLASSILAPEFRHIGTALLCNGYRCGYVVILGRPH